MRLRDGGFLGWRPFEVRAAVAGVRRWLPDRRLLDAEVPRFCPDRADEERVLREDVEPVRFCEEPPDEEGEEDDFPLVRGRLRG